MGYYSGRLGRYVYDVPTPEDMDDDNVEGLITQLKTAIEGNKLAEIKSALSKLKLAVNEKYPGYTERTAPFTAYVYAKEGGYKKAVDSIFKANIKMDFTFKEKVFPFDDFFNTMTPAQIQIIFDDFLNNSEFKWNIKGAETVTTLYDKYPKETDAFIEGGKLYKYPAGEERTNTAIAVIKRGSANAIVETLNALYDSTFMEKFILHSAKILAFLEALDTREKSIQNKVREEFFYSKAARFMIFDILKQEYDNDKLTDNIIKIYTDSLLSMIGQKQSKTAVVMEVINHLDKAGEKYTDLKVRMITSNSFLLNFITENSPSLIPSEIKDIFLF